MRNLFRTNFRFRLAALLVIGQALVLLVISVFHIGGDDFVSFMFSTLAPVYAGIATVAVFWGWKSSDPEEISRRIWGWMLAGLGLWTIAEVLWIYYTIAYQESTPFPSPADFFWVAGTFPLFMALIIRYRSFKIKIQQRQIIILAGALVIFAIVIAVFILPQIFVNADPSRWMETAINLFYTITDLIMFGLSLSIILNIQRGRLFAVWNLILWSNIIRSIADTLFAYGSWNQAVLPPNVTYAINYLFNIPYLAAYLFIALGMLANQIVNQDRAREDAASTAPKQVVYGLALIFTNAQNNVIATSNNISEKTFTKSVKEPSDLPLHAFLGADAQAVTRMIQECSQKGYITSYPIEIQNNRLGKFQVWITAIRDRNSGNGFNGLNLLVRIKADDLSLPELTGDFRSIAQRILVDSGQASRENASLLKDYFKAQIFGLYKLILSMAGGPAAEYMLDNFNQTAAYNQWHIKISPAAIFVPDELEETELGRAFVQLLKSVTSYAVDMTSAQVVAEEIKKSERGLDSKIIHAAEEFGLRGRKLSYRNIELDYKSR